MFDLNDLIDLNDPLAGQVELTSALAINDMGNIVADGVINGQTHAFLLIAAQTVPVPEPSTLAIFALSLVGLGFVRRRKCAA